MDGGGFLLGTSLYVDNYAAMITTTNTTADTMDTFLEQFFDSVTSSIQLFPFSLSSFLLRFHPF
jgi:hypothetical protein